MVRRQAEVGLDIVSDGEISKTSFLACTDERLTGFVPAAANDPSAAPTSAGAASDAATNVIASKRAGAAPGAAGRASGAKTSEVSEDVLEAELRSLDQALSTLESGHEEL